MGLYLIESYLSDMEQLWERVAALKEADFNAFDKQVQKETDRLKSALNSGTFDNPRATIGLEYEFYGVDESFEALRRVPRTVFEHIGFGKELGLHNAELTTSPQPLGPHGLAAIQNAVQSAVLTAQATSTRCEPIKLASDGFWTIPPSGETAVGYLDSAAERYGVIISSNMSGSPQYHAQSNVSTYEPQCLIDTPNVSFHSRTIMPVTLTTSIQPHYQVPVAADLPTYFGYVLRIAGPLVALAVNSPFFPPSLYDEDATVESVLTDGHLENRVLAYESVMRDPNKPDKVRFPRDIESMAEAVDRLAGDPPIVPLELDSGDRFDDQFAHLRHKHGSYWRWVRPVFEGPSKSAANVRIEFRPLPAQPTIRDSVAFLAVFAGLVHGLVHADHPVVELPWETARENFYKAVSNGLSADLAWITANGQRTSNTEEIYADLFEHTQRGLERQGFGPEDAARAFRPVRERVDRRITPASWKCDRLRHHAEYGETLATAVTAAQRDYLGEQADTLAEGVFTDWAGV
ncbi:hypothetical protein [Halobellus marinus]|uniref:hypothetical protein n=1 Tax=Halobellus TaxID=1073986 RepID=UPI0028A9C25B|nr:hypothetical protein [Halobellus sp. DFY28]